MILGWLAAGALACGGMFGPTDAVVFSDAQQAIFEPGTDEVAVEYLVDTSGELADWGWVVPIPGEFVDLVEGDADRFDDLAYDTAPSPNYHADPEARGCGGAAKGGDNALRGGDSVTVIDAGSAGVFDFTVVAATNSGALLTWLDDNGWDAGESAPSIDAYVAEGGWQFVAVSLNADAVPGPGGVVRSAARITYAGQRLVFPARMSEFSSADEQRTTIYVIGDQRATASGWRVQPFPDLELVSEDLDFAGEIAAASTGEPTAVETFAGTWGEDWVTRYDIAAASEDHVADLELQMLGGVIPFSPQIDIYASEDALEGDGGGGCALSGGVVQPWLWVAGLLALRRRRQD